MPFIRRKHWDQIEGLLQEIRQLLKQPDAPCKLGGAQVHVQIETLHMHEVKLDDLSFRLDQISIDDLSGSFNLGNNFMQQTGKPIAHRKQDESGAAVKQKEASTSGQARKASTFGGTSDDGIERSAKGYRFRYKT